MEAEWRKYANLSTFLHMFDQMSGAMPGSLDNAKEIFPLLMHWSYVPFYEPNSIWWNFNP